MAEKDKTKKARNGPFKVERFCPDPGAPATNVLGLQPDRGRWELVDSYTVELNARNRAELEAARGSCLARVYDREGEREVYRIDRRSRAKLPEAGDRNPLVP